MDAQRFAEKKSKIVGTTKVIATSIWRKDADYTLFLCSDESATDTGRVLIAKLIPKTSVLPEFFFRWDHGSAQMDVDIYLNGKSRKDWDALGYRGHTTVMVNPETREYEADIWMSDRQIFSGIIKVGLIHGLALEEQVTLTEYVDVQVVTERKSQEK